MTNTEPEPPRSFTVLVEEETIEVAPHVEIGPGEVEEQRGFIRKKILRHKALDLGETQEQLDRVQSEVDDLLGQLTAQPKHGFGLSEVQVSVGVSAQGGIGVVTAGVQASLTLIYSRPGN